MTENLVNLFFQCHSVKENKQDSTPIACQITEIQTNNYALNPKLKQDITKIKATYEAFIPNASILLDKVNEYDTFTKQHKPDNKGAYFSGVLSSLPITKRYETIKNNKDDSNNPFKAIYLVGLGLINIREDFRDLLTILGRTETKAPEGYFVRFKFFIGTFLENPMKNSSIGRWILENLDKTLADTKPADKLFNVLRINKDIEPFKKKINNFFSKEPETVYREYVKLEGSLLKKTLILASHRITVLGLTFGGLIELPKIIDAIKNKKDYKQIARSTISILSPFITGALLSSFLAITTGGAGSVIGFGLGMYLGSRFSKFINSKF